jgi:hypothetical protein
MSVERHAEKLQNQEKPTEKENGTSKNAKQKTSKECK